MTIYRARGGVRKLVMECHLAFTGRSGLNAMAQGWECISRPVRPDKQILDCSVCASSQYLRFVDHILCCTFRGSRRLAVVYVQAQVWIFQTCENVKGIYIFHPHTHV